jgi:hypothetical protein
VRRFFAERDSLPPYPLHRDLAARIAPAAIGAQFLSVIEAARR